MITSSAWKDKKNAGASSFLEEAGPEDADLVVPKDLHETAARLRAAGDAMLHAMQAKSWRALVLTVTAQLVGTASLHLQCWQLDFGVN